MDTRFRGSFRIWNVESGVIEISIDTGRDAQAVFVDGGRGLVLVNKGQGENHRVSFYDMTNPNFPPRVLSGKFSASKLVASPDGTLVAVSTLGGMVELYDAVEGKLIGVLHGHMNSVEQIVFSLDGLRLLTAGSEQRFKLWDLGSQQELMSWDESGSGMIWSSDGSTIRMGRGRHLMIAPTLDEIAAIEANDKENSSNRNP